VDIPNVSNKIIDGSESVNKADMPTTIKAVSQLINEYFFPGGGVWKPMSVKAPNREQAEEIHRNTRVPIASEAVDEKVGDSKESNNA
jgi:hypothetical protein